MLHSYIQSYVNKEINEFSTENILNLITKERQSCLLDNDMSGDNFTDNGQHDIFDLLRHFLNMVHPLVKQLFTYSTYYTFECECSNMITTASMDNCIYELTTLTNYLHFNDFFEPRMIFQNCDNCNSNQKREKIHFSITNRYLLLKVNSLLYNNIRRNIILKELNFEIIQIPRCKDVFKITAIVFHEWSTSIDNEGYGHYYLIKRINEHIWQYISDSESKFIAKNDIKLKNVYIFLLEKINE